MIVDIHFNKNQWYFVDDYGDLEDDNETAEDDWESEEALDDSEYGQKKNQEESEEIYLVPTINYETYKDESAAKKRVSNASSFKSFSTVDLISRKKGLKYNHNSLYSINR